MATALLFGDTERSAALRHEVPITIIDPLLWALVDGKPVILTSWLERDRIAAALPEAEILDYFAFGMKELREQGLAYAAAEREVVARVARHLGLTEVVVPGEFPVALADRLRADGIRVTVDDEAFQARRRAKSPAELEGIRAAQRAAVHHFPGGGALRRPRQPSPDAVGVDLEQLDSQRDGKRHEVANRGGVGLRHRGRCCQSGVRSPATARAHQAKC
jgi:Xaa-Pro aminopeptidase